MFLGCQLLEERFQKPCMTGRRDKTMPAGPVDPPDESPGQAELDELGLGSLRSPASSGGGATFVDQSFDLVLGDGGICWIRISACVVTPCEPNPRCLGLK